MYRVDFLWRKCLVGLLQRDERGLIHYNFLEIIDQLLIAILNH